MWGEVVAIADVMWKTEVRVEGSEGGVEEAIEVVEEERAR